jgi:GNAT superfamily N-acetyltransferase
VAGPWHPPSMEANVRAVTDWHTLASVFRRALGDRDPLQLQTAFESTECRLFSYVGADLVGAGRVISDGIYYGLIVDVVVEPRMHRQGIGSGLVRHLIDRVGVPLVLAQSSPGAVGFYTRMGFKTMMTGMALYRDSDRAITAGYIKP